MADPFASYSSSLESPPTLLFQVTPSDSEDLPMASRGINVSASGTVHLTTVGDTIATIHVAAGIAFPIRAKRIWQTGTTATGIVVML